LKALGEGLELDSPAKEWVQRIEGAKIKEIRFNNPAHRRSLSRCDEFLDAFVTVNVDTQTALSPIWQSR
jgi:hypothetical protein